MQELNWLDAEHLAAEYQNSDKVIAVFFVDPNCDICNEFVHKDVKELTEKYKDKYQAVYVKNTRGMAFPPTSWPTAYIFVPNCPNEMPLRRSGAAPTELVEQDMVRQITSMETGKDLDELRNASQ